VRGEDGSGTGRSGCNGGRSGESARDIGMFHGISQAACITHPPSPSPRARTLTLTKLPDRGIPRARARNREREREREKEERRRLVQTVYEAAGISRIFERLPPPYPPRSHGINGLRSRTSANVTFHRLGLISRRASRASPGAACAVWV